MQIPNREIRRLVMGGFDLLVEGLAPFLDKIMTVRLGAVDWFETFCADKKAVAGFRTRQGDLPKKFDPVFQLKLLLDRQYGNVYEELSPHAQRLCSLLRDDRNDWYHHDDLCDPQDAFAALHRIKKLLSLSGADAQAQQVIPLLNRVQIEMHHQLGLEHNHVADLTAQDGQEKVNNNLSSPPEPNVSPWDDDEPSPYVSRGQLEMAFKRIRREGAQIIAIVGSPGIGKTRLAEYLTATEKPSGEVAVRIDTGTDKAIERSMYEELVRINQSHKALQGPAIEHAFRELLVSDKAPHYVLLDNLQDITLLRRIHGPGIKSAIVLTARAQVPGIRPEHHIEVEGLSDSEGIELVSKLLPNATKADAFKLVHILGGNALAIVAACGFLKDDPGLTIDKLCVKLPETAALLFDGVTVGNYPALTAIYRETIIRIRDVDPQAYSLLRLVVFLADSPIFINLLAECFKVALADSDLNTEHLGVVWRRGLGYLKRHYLVSIENSNIGMHQLTRAIMGHLLAEHKLIVSTHLYDGILQGCRELFRQISAKDEEPLNLFGVVNAETGEHLMKVLATIRSVSSSSLSFVQLWPEVVAQLLSTIGYDPFDFLVVILPTGESDYSCSIRRRSRKEIEASQFMASLNVEEMRQVSGPSQIIALRPRLHRFKAAQDSEILLMPTIVAWRQEDLELDQNGDRSV